MSQPPQSIEDVVEKFNRERSEALENENVELEVRFKDVDYNAFRIIYDGILSGQIKTGAGILTQSVESRMDSGRRNETLVREIVYERGKGVSNKFWEKRRLTLPFRVEERHALSYIVSLSLERPAEEFISNTRALIRVKTRASFPYPAKSLSWQIDLTVVRQISGTSVQELPGIVNELFVETTGTINAGNILKALKLTGSGAKPDSRAGKKEIYNYEVELEFIGDEEQAARLTADEVTELIGKVLEVSHPDFSRETIYQNEIFHVANFVFDTKERVAPFRYNRGLKSLSPQVISLSRTSYREIFPPLSYFLTDKADGERAVASVRNNQCIIICGATCLEASRNEKAERAETANSTILDGELVRHKGKKYTFYAFDAIVVDGENIARKEFRERIAHIERGVEILGLFDSIETSEGHAAGFSAAKKTFFHLENLSFIEKQFKELARAKKPYKTDGIILTEPGKPYRSTRSFKWKPVANTTIDFLARKCPPGVLGRHPYVAKRGHTLYFLFSATNASTLGNLGIVPCPGYDFLFGKAGVGGENRVPIQFSPSFNPHAYIYHHPDSEGDIDERIVEMMLAEVPPPAPPKTPKWKFVRTREDKENDTLTCNDIFVAETIWMTLVDDEFRYEELYEGPSLDYFLKPKGGIHMAHTAVSSALKSTKIMELSHSGWVVDLGSGKGQDLNRYMDAHVHNLVVIDRDKAALTELVQRKYSITRKMPPSKEGMTTLVRVVVSDLLTEKTEEISSKVRDIGLPVAGADAVVCNYAVNYFTGSTGNITKFVMVAKKLLKVGGTLIITTFSGADIHATLVENGVRSAEKWNLYEDDVLKFSIKRLYESDSLERSGQKIGVMLPFSEGRYYEEYLVNVEYLTSEILKRGFVLLATTAVSDSIEDFRTRNPQVGRRLTQNDIEWLSFQKQMTFKKMR